MRQHSQIGVVWECRMVSQRVQTGLRNDMIASDRFSSYSTLAECRMNLAASLSHEANSHAIV